MAKPNRDHMIDVARQIWAVAPEMSPGSVERMMSFCADDLVMEWPFGPPEPCVGKPAARDFLLANLVEFDAFVNEGVFCDEAQGTVIAMGYSQGRNPRSGKPYRNRYVLVFQFGEDGLIHRWYEYLNPIAVLAAAE